MASLLANPSIETSLGSFITAHTVCTTALAFTPAKAIWTRRIAAALVFSFTLLGDRTVQAVSENASLRCLLVTFSWVQAINAHSLLCLSKIEYTPTVKSTKKIEAVVRSIYYSEDTGYGNGSLASRVLWAWSTQWNLRRIRTPRPARNIPPFSYKEPSHIPSRGRFILNRATVILVSMGYMVLLGLQPQPTTENFSVAKASFLSRIRDVSPSELRFRALATLSWIVGIGATSQICYNLMAIMFVGSGLSEPVMWPAWFASFSEAYSIRNWWGISWQQTWQRFLADHADWITSQILHLPKASLLTRYTKYLIVFYISGLLHVAPDLAIGMPLRESYAITFYVSQAAGIMFEDFVRHINEKVGLVKNPVLARIIGHVWLAVWLVWQVPIWSFPCNRYMQTGKDDLVSISRNSTLAS